MMQIGFQKKGDTHVNFWVKRIGATERQTHFYRSRGSAVSGGIGAAVLFELGRREMVYFFIAVLIVHAVVLMWICVYVTYEPKMLLRSRKAATPPHVTVEMLAQESPNAPDYKPGQWVS
jgi:hypothetical protein